MDFLWPLVTFGSLGAFVDFVLGRAGQKSVRDRLELWWYSLADVHWYNFGQRESHAFLLTFDRCCGKHLFSLQRLYVSMAASLLCLIFAMIAVFVYDFNWLHVTVGHSVAESLRLYFFPQPFSPNGSFRELIGETLGWEEYGVFFTFDAPIYQVLPAAILFALSISATRAMSYVAMRATNNDGALRNLAVFAALMCTHYLLLISWAPIAEASASTIVDYIRTISDHPGDLSLDFPPDTIRMEFAYNISDIGFAGFDPTHLLAYFSQRLDLNHDLATKSSGNIPSDFMSERMIFMMSSGINLVRLMSAIIFMLVNLMRYPAKILMILWARVIENDKPVFTLLGGALGALATALMEILKHI